MAEGKNISNTPNVVTGEHWTGRACQGSDQIAPKQAKKFFGIIFGDFSPEFRLLAGYVSRGGGILLKMHLQPSKIWEISILCSCSSGWFSELIAHIDYWEDGIAATPPIVR